MRHLEIAAFDGEPGGGHAQLVGGDRVGAGGEQRAHPRGLVVFDREEQLFVQFGNIRGPILRARGTGQ